jgi:undecaprenyl diphosphate synthase
MAVLRILKVADVASSSEQSSQHSTFVGGGSHHFWFAHPDNESQATTTSSCWNAATDSMFDSNLCSNQCQCTPNLFYRILYWCKMILIKLGRSYYALPGLLLLATLLLGVIIGFFIGRQYSSYLTKETPVSVKPQRVQLASTPLFTDPCYYAITALSALYSWFNYFFEIYMRRIMPFLAPKHTSFTEESVVLGQQQDVCTIPTLFKNEEHNNSDIEVKEEMARCQLLSEDETECESGLQPNELPRHVAVVMDGNRRHGIQKYNNAIQGHWDGSKKLLQFSKWCLAEHIGELTVYAFSTENWSREGAEITSLMNIILKHCEELRIEAIKKHISIHIHSTDPNAIPYHVREALHQLQTDTYTDKPALRMNICLSYGSRGEIVNACRSMVEDFALGRLTSPKQINEDSLSERMLISGVPPDILIRTSGEIRLSNFLLWQMAYTELFFLSKNWPELQKDDFLNVLRSYAKGRQRRYGK